MATKSKVKAKNSTPSKKLSNRSAQPSKVKSKTTTKTKKVVSPELQEAHERAQWQKEKRLYWSSRFRRILAEITSKPKAKKAGAL